MKAVGFTTSLPIGNADSLADVTLDKPAPGPRDILVKIEAISVNPVDYKIRQNSLKGTVAATPRIPGWDAAGIVEAVGAEVSGFAAGDAVYYAGDINRPGSYAEYQLVDERIAGRRPGTLSPEAAAAMPLTALTAWEMLFDRIRIGERDKGKSILIIGGGGGVGSIAIQLAARVAGLEVIATASRPETAAWCREMGARHIADHRNLVASVRDAGFRYADFILDLVDVNTYWDDMAELISPQGHIASITGSSVPVALNKLKSKSVSFSWELMFTRSSFCTADMLRQQEILNEVARLLDEGTLVSTLKETMTGLDAATLRRAQEQLESGRTIGKLAIRY